MDIAEFNVIRPPREVDDQVVRLTESVQVTHPVQQRSAITPSHSPPPHHPFNLEFDKLPKTLTGKSLDPARGTAGKVPGTVLGKVFALVRRLDRFLAEKDDRVTGSRLVAAKSKLAAELDLDNIDWKKVLDPAADARAIFPLALLCYRHWLVGELGKRDPDFDGVTRVSRLALVAALFREGDQGLAGVGRIETFDRLNRRTLVLDGVTTKNTKLVPKVTLIKEAKVGDLKVVRREWAGYLAGEIANIRNVMAGEGFRQHDNTTAETETTTVSELEQRRVAETEESTKLQSELSQEVNNQLYVTINGYAGAAATFSYGGTATVAVSAGVDAGFSMLRSERQARKIAREAVSRAVSRIDSMTREARTRRELMRTEQGFAYKLDNDTGKNLHGVYRWVDRIDTYQVFSYPNRFLLEFQIPDPAEFYRWRTDRAEAADADKPPDWDLKLGDIATDRLLELAAKYRATNVPAPPDPYVSVVRTLSVEPGKEWEPANFNTDVMNPPTATKELEIPIPANYEAVSVSYEGAGYPVQGKWNMPSAQNSGTGWKYGYHSAFATVSIGKESRQYWNGGGSNRTNWAGASIDKAAEYQSNANDHYYGASTLTISTGTGRDPQTAAVKFDQPTRDLVKIGLTTSGLGICTITAYTYCMLTQEASHEWRLAVYDTLYNAWAAWKRDYESSQRSAVLASSASDAGGTQRNEQVIREELKRETISWLLDKEHFQGRPGRHPRPSNDFADVDFDRARVDAPTIQFLEQAFEWSNMAWFFYPYYWAERDEWDDRARLVANDPEFERFLRSGSARVIVPARPGFEVAVGNWLMTQEPFISGRLPSPDEDLYVSIDREIRELTSPLEGGTPGDHWQSRVGTTMLYLEEKGDLPFINKYHELPAPKGIEYKPKPIIDFTATTPSG